VTNDFTNEESEPGSVNYEGKGEVDEYYRFQQTFHHR
jgi:hypothetical protein